MFNSRIGWKSVQSAWLIGCADLAVAVGKGSKKRMELNAEELDGVLDVTKLRGDMEAVVQDLKEQMMSQVSIRTNIGQLAVCVCVCVCVCE